MPLEKPFASLVSNRLPFFRWFWLHYRVEQETEEMVVDFDRRLDVDSQRLVEQSRSVFRIILVLPRLVATKTFRQRRITSVRVAPGLSLRIVYDILRCQINEIA